MYCENGCGTKVEYGYGGRTKNGGIKTRPKLCPTCDPCSVFYYDCVEKKKDFKCKLTKKTIEYKLKDASFRKDKT